MKISGRAKKCIPGVLIRDVLMDGVVFKPYWELTKK